MTSPRTGADRCPGLLRPFLAEDGAIVRLRVPGGAVPVAVLRALLEVGAELGAPVIQLTSRGNLQLRALPDPLPPAAMDRIEATGLLPSASHERVRNVLAAPLADDLGPLVAALDAAIVADPALAGLPGRWLFALSDHTGSVLTEPWDVAWQGLAGNDGLLLVRSRDGILGMPCARPGAVARLLDVARLFLAERDGDRVWNLRDLPSGSAVFGGPDGPLTPAAPTMADPPAPGRHDRGLVVGVPLGMLRPRHLDALAAVTEQVTVTPWRSLVLPPGAAATETLAALDAAGLVTSPASGWTRLSACVGAPSCRRTDCPTLDIATDVVDRLGGDGPHVHIVGCERHCGAASGSRQVIVVSPRDADAVVASAEVSA